MLNLKIPAGPAMVRLGIAAKMCGVSEETFFAAVQAGTIPVTIEQISPRINLIRLPELLAWLNRHHTAQPNEAQ